MALPALKSLGLALALLLTLAAATSLACFGPKLFIGVTPGLEGELRFHLIAIYLHEKTGIDSTLIELKPGQSAAAALAADEIDFGFGGPDSLGGAPVLNLGEGLWLYSGPRPLNDLQFSTVGRTLAKLQQRLGPDSLKVMREAVSAGVLPAVAVRDYLHKNGWI
jgi:hypothetical protein